jgi:hypothetical protein
MPGFMARLKGIFGGSPNHISIAAAATITVPDHAGWVNLTGTDTVTSLRASPSSRGRIVFFNQTDSGTTTFTNTNDTTTEHLMDTGGSNAAVGQSDVLALRLRPDGSWVRVFLTDN